MDWNDKEQVRQYMREYAKTSKAIAYNKSPKGKARFKRYREKNPDKVKEWNDKHNLQSIRFKGKSIKLDHNPRTGICSKCGEKRLTNLHHTKYDDSDPLKYTIELCVPCHNKQHLSKRNKLGQFTKIEIL
ncbi:MAG: hypothetical protein H8D23_09545 [Candidatus Brocadiales bacterium]|nr:hypothetical protein [Candidatus Brocadiales bacterium]